jgi:hypothetical protein
MYNISRVVNHPLQYGTMAAHCECAIQLEQLWAAAIMPFVRLWVSCALTVAWHDYAAHAVKPSDRRQLSIRHHPPGCMHTANIHDRQSVTGWGTKHSVHKKPPAAEVTD